MTTSYYLVITDTLLQKKEEKIVKTEYQSVFKKKIKKIKRKKFKKRREKSDNRKSVGFMKKPVRFLTFWFGFSV